MGEGVRVVSWVLLGFAIVALVRYVAAPYVILQRKRYLSFRHMPQREEVWAQDHGILYIDETTASGISIIAFDPDTRQATRWTETWDQWYVRLKTRTVWYTGTKQPLGDL